MVKYSIPICNYNMSDTLERSLRSILTQVDERFEVLVVDDGSDDGSKSVLSRLEKDFDRLNTLFLQPDQDRKLGETRNISVRNAAGDFVLLHMDADDEFRSVIPDVVTVFEELRKQVDFEFYLQGAGINVVKKDFFLEEIGGYRNLPVGAEDLDMWRRLLDDGRVIWLDNELIWEPIGHYPHFWDLRKREFRIRIADFQCGIRYTSCLQHSFDDASWESFVYDVLVYTIAYVLSKRKEGYETPAQFRRKGAVREERAKRKKTLREIQQCYGVEIDCTQLSDEGREVFRLDHS